LAALTMANDLAGADPSGPVRQLSAVVMALADLGAFPEMLAATGGETAQTLGACLGIGHLELICELEPGVIISTVMDRERPNPKWMTIKPGGFGSDGVWCSLIRDGCDFE